MTRNIFGRPRDAPDGDREPEYWLSYSDLMAGLLMAFALVLMVALGQRDGCPNLSKEKAEALEKILDTRRRVIDSLRIQLADSGTIAVDTAGTVRFRGSLLFDQASAELSREGETVLTTFARNYFPVLLNDPEFRGVLKRIVVEGHTNDDGGYELNLKLSHQRSLAVMLVLLQAADDYRDDLEALGTANGRSYADLIRKPSGEVDKVRSRRIEIRFQMDDEALAARAMELGRLLTGPNVGCET